ncbi:MAG TPA: hypothetical protein PKO27_12640 [Deltaproteobacteria bacterium]|jgi:hypothetical protein|nr:hypothetical protein [Deltaproteobacteria bacterium]HOS46918.1 hypothetical protein [Paludibacter sp.]
MALWKITDKGPAKVKETKFKQEKLLEEHLEDWIASDPSMLGEPLLLFGRQVIIPDTKDRLDLLAVDSNGSITVIELKRGQLKDPVDIQSLRYASYVSKWHFQDFENVARNYFGKIGDAEFNFNDMFESFCAESGVDAIPDINTEQRIIIVGSSVREKLGSVALWLREHSIDIKLIEVQAYKEGDNLFIEPTTIVPMPVSRFISVGKRGTESQPWSTDGKSWHLEKRCSPKTKEMLLLLDQIVQDEFEIEGPKWSQQNYVAYPINNYNWLCVHTKPRFLVIDLLVKTGVFKTEDLAKRLGVEKFDTDETLAEKLGMPSTVFVKNRNQKSDRVRLRAKEDFDVKSKSFIDFLKDAFKAFPK